MGIHEMIALTDRGPPAHTLVAGLPGSEADALEAALTDMTTAFLGDFVNGRVGERYNTYEHRSRVLRQMTQRLAVMRARDAMAVA